MVLIHLNFENISYRNELKEIFKDIPDSDEYELTLNGVFRRKEPPVCEICGAQTTHNGYNTYSKDKLGKVKIGKLHCPKCGHNLDEDRSFWERMKDRFRAKLGTIALNMNAHCVSFEGIADILKDIYPISKTCAVNLINDMLNELPEEIFTKLPEGSDYVIVHYDEQYVKVNGKQKYRLTLLNQNGEVVGEQLFDFLTPEAIFFFLCEYLDPNRRTFIVTDCDPAYPSVFEAFFGENYIHQLCLFHLNKLIVKEFPRNGTIADEYMKYRFLNIFYDRGEELTFIEALLAVEEAVLSDPTINYDKWLKRARRKVRKYIHSLKKARRRAHENLPQRTCEDAKEKMCELIYEYNDLPKHLQKRLKMIAKNWDKFSAFYKLDGAPGTNNRIENFYSRSAKTHRKKQFRADIGVEGRLKLTILRINGYFSFDGVTLSELYSLFQPFRTSG